MDGIRKKPINIKDLEKRLMFDASLGALAASTTISENLANATPQIIDSNVTLTGTTTNFDGLAIDISTSGDASDQLSIHNEGSGFGDIGFDGTNITYSGVQIGTLSSNGSNGTDLSIELNGNADKTGIENLIENITYQNTSDNPVIARNISFALEGLFTESITVNISPDNDTPVINTNAGMSLDEGDTRIITAAMLGISDPDNTDAEISITLNNTLSNGRLELTTNTSVAITEFTLEDLNNNRVQYVHDDTNTTSDNFNFSVDDGGITLAAQDFNITIVPVDDALVLESNAGADVFNGFSTDIGGTEVPAQFGNTLLERPNTSLGEFDAFENIIDSNNITQLRIVITTPAALPTAVPGQVIFETGGSGRGIALILNENNELEFYAGNASTTPEIVSPIALSTSTQYAIVVELDQPADELRLHYAQSNDFDWYQYGRVPEAIDNNFSDPDYSGSNRSGLGALGSGSLGGYNGSFSGTTTFQGSIDSNFIISQPPAGQTVIQNTNLVYNDNDTDTDDIIYTITTDVLYGTLYNDGVALGLGDTFTQADLDAGDIDYTHDGGATPNDSFGFSVSDGNTILNGNSYAINVITGNTAPTTADDTFTIAEDAGNGNNVGQVTATDPDTAGGQVLTYSITAGNADGIFQIDAATGLISVADNTSLDYETTTSYTLTVRATDDGPGTLFDEGTITINIQDVYEGTAPVFTAWGPYNIDENAANNTVVGTVTTTDAEGDNVGYSITGGNTNNAFKINNSGVIQVNGNGKIDFEQNTTYTLTVRATDNSVDTLFSQRTITININDLNEGPTLEIDGVIATIDKTVNYFADNGNFYKYYNNNVNFNTALNNAATADLNGANGHLITITSDDENNFVDSIMGNHIWLAASDAEVEGQWKWVAGPEAGSVFSLGGTATAGFYERWNGSEPNSGAGANYAYMNTNSTWYDQNGGSRYYVVEWESMDVINNREYSIDYSTPGGGDINNGDSLGFVQGGDDDGDTLAYSITGGNGDGIFEIDGVTGELRIADDTNINTALNSDYTLTVRVDDGSGLFATKDIAINFNQLLSIGTNEALAATEGASVTITTAELNILDNDTAATDLVISITSQPSHGQLELTTAPGAAINSFTQDDLANNRVIFVSNGDENTTDSFEFSVSDGSYSITGQTFDIDVTNTNDSPVISINTGANVLEGGSRVITSAMLDALDSDDVASGLTYTATNLANGHIEVSGVTQATFTQADIDAGNVRFVHNGDEGNGSFDIELADSGADSATTDTATFTLTKTDVNDAPIVAVNAGASVVEGQSVIVTSAMLAATDIDNNNANLVYTLNNQFNGNFVFASDPAIPITSFTQDDINNNRVLFQHDGNEQDGIVEFSVADDGADGALPASGTFTITKIDVNDAPTIAVNAGTSVNQNSIVILKNSVLAAADTDDAPSGIDYTIDSVSGGQLEYLATPNVAITSFTQADIDNSLVVFRHADPAASASFDFTVSDGGENLAGTASGTFNLTVDNTNNAPDITTNSPPTMDEGTTLTLDNTMLDSFDPDDFGAELTWTATNLQSGILQVGGVTQNTFTQADLDNGDVTFIHDGSQTVTAGFTVTLADGGENNATTDTVFFKINIDQINNLPSIDANSGDTLNESGTVTIDNTELATSDSDINEADWYDGNWQYRQQITLESDYVDADLNDFTLLISGDNFSRDFWDNVKADGSDIVITLADGTKLSRELVSINRGAERMELHVNIPTLSSTVDTELFIYYGNFAASETNDAATVFADYDHVYHMNQLNAVDIIGANNATNSGGGSITTGVMGNAHSYNGAGRLDIAEINGADIASVSFWYRPDNQGGGNYGSILGSNSYNYGIRHTATDALHLRDNASNILSTTPDFDTFKHLVFSYDQGAGTINLYENGVLQDTSAFTGWYDVQHLIAISGDSARAIDGIVDEIRITGEVITQEQAAAEFANQSTPSLFYSLSGQQQYVPEVLTYTVSTDAANGTLYLDANTNGTLDGGEALALNDTFTQDDIDAGLLLYTHDGGESISDSFGYTISDADGTTAAQTFNFTINPVNDVPVISTNAPPTINEGASVTLTDAMLDVTDPDDADADLLWTISNLTNGTLEVDGTAQSTFTHAQLINGDVVFIHDGGETTSAGFDIQVADDEGAAASGSFAITVTPVNDLPVLSGDYAITMDEGASYTITATDLGSTDPDDIAANRTFTATNITNGHIEVSGVTATTFTQANLDAGNVAFIHDGSETLTAGFDIALTDDDGAGPDTATMAITITPVNDAPVTTNNGFSTNEGATATITTAALNITDPDNAAADLVVNVTSATSNGYLALSTDSATPITSFTLANLQANQVIYVHNGGETTTDSFAFTVTDGTNTLAADTFSIAITPVNDAPTLILNDGDPNILDLNNYTFVSYSNEPGQDVYGNAVVSADGTTVTFTNINAWKEISTPYTLTTNTVLSFEFFSDRALEIQGIGFENGNTDFNFLGYELLGSQNWNLNDSYRGYQAGDGWVRYDITIGQNFTSATDITTMIFALDNDANATGTTAFRNINFYESDLIVEVEEGGALTLTNTHLNSIDPDDTPADRLFTATNITNGHIELSGVTTTTFTQADIDAGNVAFIHDGSQTLSAGFDIALTDDDGAGTDTGRFDIIVNAVDDAPATATNNGLTTPEGGTTTITTAALTTSDVDTPASDVIFTVTNNVDNGRLALSINTAAAISSFTLADLQNNRVIYVHNSGETTTDSFTFTISDGTTTVPADTFNISITPVNDAPIIIGDNAATMAEGASYTITNADVNYTDADDAAAAITYTATNITNGHIEVSGVSATSFTQANINAGNVRFIHDGSETITAGFDLAITDDEGAGTDTATMAITITPVDDAPVATNNGLSTNEGATATITTAALNITDSDTAATNLVVNVTSATSNGYLALSTDSATPITSFTLANLQANQVIYVHNGGETTTDSFNFTVSDGTNTLASDTFSIAITPVNDAVTLATNTGANVGESNAVTINNTMLNTTDIDNTAAQITYTVTGTNNGWVELTTKSGFPVTSFTQSDINNNRVVFRHDGSGQTAASFAFSVNDTGADGTAPATGTFALTVTPPVNEDPVIAVSDGTPTTIDFSTTTVTAYDPTGVGDGQGSTPTAFKVSGDGSVLSIYGNAWKRIPLPMTITADTVITFDYRSTKEGEIHGIGFDNDNSYSNGHHAYEIFGTDTNGGFDQTYNTYSLGDGWTRYEIPVGADYTGAITHMFFVADDDNGANSDAISQFRNVSIYEANPALSANEGGSVTITNANLNAFDTDDAPAALTFTATNITNGHIEVSGVTATSFTQADINAGNVAFIHDGSETLTAGFDITLTDDDGAGTDTASLSITITPVNDAPAVTGDYTLSVNEGAGVTITATDLGSTDPDDTAANRLFTATNITNGHIEVSGVTATSFTQADINAGNVRFIHDGSETLSAGFDIALTDDDGAGTDTATMAITVTPTNDAPTAVNLSDNIIFETAEVGTVIGALSSVDADLPGDSFTYSITSNPFNLFAINGNQLVLALGNTIDFDTMPTLSVDIETNDGNGGTYTQTLTINVIDNTPPTDVMIDNTTIAENTAIGTVLGTLSGTDPDTGDVLTYSLMDDAGGMFRIEGNQVMVNGALDYESASLLSITVRVTDLNSNSFDRTMAIAITDVEEADPFTNNTGPGSSNNNVSSFYNNFTQDNKRSLFSVSDILNPEKMFAPDSLIASTILNGPGLANDSAFYGDVMQILRSNTATILQDLPGLQESIVIALNGDINAPAGQAPGSEIDTLQNNNTLAGELQEFMAQQDQLKQALLEMQEMQNTEAFETGSAKDIFEITSIDDQFRDVITYQQQKQAALREALLKS